MSTTLPAITAQSIDAIVVGASVGGIEALGQLLPALPAGLQAAVFIVQHLPRDRPSLLVDIFQPGCALAVREPDDKEPVAPGTVYFAPPDYHLLVDRASVERGRAADEPPLLLLSADDPVLFARPAIDVLFESAADLYGPRALGIVLSGANADGADGLRAIHAAGGIAVVQDPQEAPASLMPLSALQRCPAAHVLTLAQIRALLAGLS